MDTKKKTPSLENELQTVIAGYLEKKNPTVAKECKKIIKKSAKAIAKKFEKKLAAEKKSKAASAKKKISSPPLLKKPTAKVVAKKAKK